MHIEHIIFLLGKEQLRSSNKQYCTRTWKMNGQRATNLEDNCVACTVLCLTSCIANCPRVVDDWIISHRVGEPFDELGSVVATFERRGT